MSSKTAIFGSVLIITGTAIGAGMLAIPMVTAQLGFITSIVFLLAAWALMTYTAVLMTEATLAMPAKSSYSSIARQALGRTGQAITSITFLFFLYSIISAYITAGSSLISVLVASTNNTINTLVFTGLFGCLVLINTKTVDRANRVLVLAKIVGFIIIVTALVPHLDSTLITRPPISLTAGLFSFPILITSFGFHIVIPSLRDYLQLEPRKLKLVVIGGSTIPLAIYLIWELVTLGVVPEHGPNSLTQFGHDNVEHLIQALTYKTQSSAVSFGSHIFTDLAVTTSFLGVSLSLYDFAADSFNLKKSCFSHRSKLAIIIYAIPVAFAISYPEGFVLALNYASVFVAVLLVILPPLMVWRLRGGSYKFKDSWALALTIIAGLLIIILALCQ